MQKPDETFFSDYLLLRNEIDTTVKRLEEQHRQHMKCKSGCDMCCTDYSILPVEFHFIINELKKEAKQFDSENSKNETTCVFLKNHVCQMYKHRPVICRTHGLPLVFMNDNEEWELSACELNFTEFNFDNFTLDNTFEQDRFNSKLFVLNKKFTENYAEHKYKEFELIPIKNILKHL